MRERQVDGFSEPAVLWRLRRGRDEARATVIPGSPVSTLVFLVNDELDRGENYDALDAMLARAEEVRRELLDQGWRPVEPDPD
ncbi:MAG TPA: hypothetical protein VF198_03970 [Vicinamibacterales bacterium]